MNKKVLILDRVDSLFLERLPQMAFDVEEAYDRKAEDINWSGYHGLVLRSRMPINAAILQQCSQMKFIARVGAGLENIDLDAAAAQSIAVLSAPEGNRNAVGEQALGMLLALFNRLLIADREVREGLWLRSENRGYELKGKVVGLVGYGNTGSAFAKKLRGLECRVLAYDKYKKGFSSPQVEEVSLDRLKREADVISFHLPQTSETDHLFNEEFINSCKKDFFLINTARGSIVDTKALVKALKSDKVKGACLDVLEFEKSSFENIGNDQSKPELDYLLKSDKVVLSPHIAGWTFESKLRMAEILLHKIEKLAYD